MKILRTFGDRLKYSRLNFGIAATTELTQQELSKLSGINSMHISHFECNRRQPSIKNLIKLCKALHVSSDFLLNL